MAAQPSDRSGWFLPRWARAAYWRVRRGGLLDLVPDDALPDRLLLIKKHRRIFGRLRLFLRPCSFQELLYSQMMWDRRPALRETAEKVSARDWVAARIGAAHLVPAPFIGERPEDIPFDDLPDRFVIKASHGSGHTVIIQDKAALDRDAVRRQVQGWLDTDFHRIHREWCYAGVPRRILIETLLEQDGKLAADHRLFVFGGRVRLIQLTSDRLGDRRQTFFDERWRALTCEIDFRNSAPHQRDTRLDRPLDRLPPPPATLGTMIRIAERLGAEFAFCRVDLYTLGERVYFGEITHYPFSGNLTFQAPFDRVIGDLWRRGTPIPERLYRR